MIFIFIQFAVPLIIAFCARKRSVKYQITTAVIGSYTLTLLHHVCYVFFGSELTDAAGGLAFIIIFGGWIYPLLTALLFVFIQNLLRRRLEKIKK